MVWLTPWMDWPEAEPRLKRLRSCAIPASARSAHGIFLSLILRYAGLDGVCRRRQAAGPSLYAGGRALGDGDGGWPLLMPGEGGLAAPFLTHCHMGNDIAVLDRPRCYRFPLESNVYRSRRLS